MPDFAFDTENDNVILKLSTAERFGALHGDVTIPISSIRQVWIQEKPWNTRPWRGMRVGTGLPFVILLGRTVAWKTTDFVAVYSNDDKVVVMDLDETIGSKFHRTVVTSKKAEEVYVKIQEMMDLFHEKDITSGEERRGGGGGGGGIKKSEDQAETIGKLENQKKEE